MKKISKFVALALACVMALAMLTACGGASAGPANDNNTELLRVVNATAQKYGHSKVERVSELDKVAESLLAANEAYSYQKDFKTWAEAGTTAVATINKMTINGGKVLGVQPMGGATMPQNDDLGKYSIFATRNVDYVGIASGTVNGHFTFVIVCANKR